MAEDVDSDEDGLQSGFFYFIRFLEKLADPAEKQAASMPEGLTPWDVQDDALWGLYMRNHPDLAFSPSLKDKMDLLTEELQRLPDAALYPVERPFTRANCLAAMNHSAWTPLRLQAAKLLEELEPAIQRNRRSLHLD